MDRRIGRLAASQHGVVSLGQLVELGLSRRTVPQRLDAGRLYLIHRGVYAVGRPGLTPEGQMMAAVLACGPSAVVSHRSAASALGILPDSRPQIDVIAINRRGRPIAGVRAHACHLVVAEMTTVDRIPCTSVARTLLDLAGVVPERRLRSAVRGAEILRILDVRAVEAAARRVSRPRGVVALRRVIAEFDPEMLYSESDLEERFLDLCQEFGLPMPQVNVPLEVDGIAIRPDCLWRKERLIVELDSRRHHSTPSGVERNKRRDQRLLLAGWTTVRVTWSQVTAEADATAEAIRRLLAQHRPARQ